MCNHDCNFVVIGVFQKIDRFCTMLIELSLLLFTQLADTCVLIVFFFSFQIYRNWPNMSK